MKIAILGAGLAGLELGRRLRILGKDFTIFEKENQIGGLARTFRTGGYSWDLGVHAMYSKDAAISRYYETLPIDYQRSTRNVKIRHGAKLISYPFENGINELPLKDRWECVRGYLTSRKRRGYLSLEDWIDNCLGQGISKHFMAPYNRKIWSCSLSEISASLVDGKIEPMGLPKFILTALGWKTVGRKYQSEFVYPLNGIQELIDYTASTTRDRIQLNVDAKQLRKSGGKWSIGGTEFDLVVSTIPLPELLKYTSIIRTNRLRWNDTYFVMVGLKEGRTFGKYHDCHWVFFKGNEIFYRLTFMHNFSSKFPPAVVAEVTDKGHSGIRDYVLKDLIHHYVIKDFRDIAVSYEKRVEYTYPIPTENMDFIVEIIEEEFKRSNLHLLGRNGRWRYINMDGVLKEVDEYVTKTFCNHRRDRNQSMVELLGIGQQGFHRGVGAGFCRTL